MSDALTLLAGLVLEDGRTWAEVAHDFQLDDARAVFAPADAGPRRHFLVRPRGASKTGDAAGVALALMVTDAPPRSRSYAYAVDIDQSQELLDALGGYVERTPGLAGAVRIDRRTVTVRATGATLQIETSDAASAFNKRPWLVIIDELASWPNTENHRKLWGAIVTALPKRTDARLLVLSMAGSPHHPSHRRWTHALSSSDWHARHVSGPCPWWEQADVEAVRGDVTESEFRRYIMAEWVEADDALSTEADVLACVAHQTLPPVPGVRYLLTLDVGTRRDATALAVSHVERGRDFERSVVVVDRVLRWQPDGPNRRVDLDEVEDAAARLSHDYNGATLAFDRMQAEQLVGRLARVGVRCEEYVFSQAGANRLARALYTHLRDRAVRLPDDPALIEELQNVRLVETGPGTLKLINPPGTHDDMAVVVGMAIARLTERREVVAEPMDVRAMLDTFAGRGSLVSGHVGGIDGHSTSPFAMPGLPPGRAGSLFHDSRALPAFTSPARGGRAGTAVLDPPTVPTDAELTPASLSGGSAPVQAPSASTVSASSSWVDPADVDVEREPAPPRLPSDEVVDDDKPKASKSGSGASPSVEPRAGPAKPRSKIRTPVLENDQPGPGKTITVDGHSVTVPWRK